MTIIILDSCSFPVGVWNDARLPPGRSIISRKFLVEGEQVQVFIEQVQRELEFTLEDGRQ